MEQQQNVLHLTLSKKWFDMIAYGDKREEYREIKPDWISRLLTCNAPKERPDDNKNFAEDFMFDVNMQHPIEDIISSYYATFKPFDLVSANNGYQFNCPNVTWKHKGIRIGTGREDWGAEPGKQYFILEIGEIVSKSPF